LHESLGDIPPAEFEELYATTMSELALANNIT
jgi:hypothetical protein